jgi:hypothetical protein
MEWTGAQEIKDRIHDLAIVNSRALSALRQKEIEKRPFRPRHRDFVDYDSV